MILDVVLARRMNEQDTPAAAPDEAPPGDGARGAWGVPQGLQGLI